MSKNSQNQNILIAKITSAQGIKGHVNIMSFAANPADIFQYKPVFDEEGKEFEIKAKSEVKGKNNDMFIAAIKGINNRNEAQNLRNKELFINKEQLPQAEEGEFYYVDLIGLKALDVKGNLIGKVINVYDFGAGAMVEVKFTDKKKESELFAFNDDIIPQINLTKGELQINLDLAENE